MKIRSATEESKPETGPLTQRSRRIARIVRGRRDLVHSSASSPFVLRVLCVRRSLDGPDRLAKGLRAEGVEDLPLADPAAPRHRDPVAEVLQRAHRVR